MNLHAFTGVLGFDTKMEPDYGVFLLTDTSYPAPNPDPSVVGSAAAMCGGGFWQVQCKPT